MTINELIEQLQLMLEDESRAHLPVVIFDQDFPDTRPILGAAYDPEDQNVVILTEPRYREE